MPLQYEFFCVLPGRYSLENELFYNEVIRNIKICESGLVSQG